VIFSDQGRGKIEQQLQIINRLILNK
jgi:hypothetical protein